MARKKVKGNGFHLKFIPAGRLPELISLAKSFPYVKDADIALFKYIEVFSSIVERSWNSEKEFVGVSQRMLKVHLKIDYSGASRILNDLVKGGFLIRSTKKFKSSIKAWDYKPVYRKLDMVVIWSNGINKRTNEMLSAQAKQNISPEVNQYFGIIKKCTLDNSIYDYMRGKRMVNEDLRDKFLEIISGERGNIYCDSFVPYELVGRIPVELISVFKILARKYRISRPIEDSRVYTNTTNLARDYRKFLRLNGKPLVGFDISNCQRFTSRLLPS